MADVTYTFEYHVRLVDKRYADQEFVDKRLVDRIARRAARGTKLLEFSGLGIKLLEMPGVPDGEAVAVSADGQRSVRVEGL